MKIILNKLKSSIFILIIFYIIAIIYSYYHTINASDWIMTIIISTFFVGLILILSYFNEKIKFSSFLIYGLIPLSLLIFSYLMNIYLTTKVNYASGFGASSGTFIGALSSKERRKSLTKIEIIILIIFYICLGYLVLNYLS